jgi:secondary thiamine-phosphate synthase enzyme
MKFKQAQFSLVSQGQKIQIITDQIVDHCGFIKEFEQGMLNVFLRHSSASLSINENSDPDVRLDLKMALDKLAPEDLPYRHADEGPDDMPAHVKSSLMGVSLSIPIVRGKLALGRWQGIYLLEHRSSNHEREIVCSAFGI